MIEVVIIGSGNVAQHLIHAFNKANQVKLIQVFARNSNENKILIDDPIISDFKELKEADLYIIAVSDQAVSSVSSQIPFTHKLVVHTSGSIPLLDLDSKNRRGVFYPLQTFTIDKAIDFSTIPICLETENTEDYTLLATVAQHISKVVYPITTLQRKSLHVSAVFVCNFVNHLYYIGETICNEHQVSFELLKPLILETAQKVMTLSPSKAQTGPAHRQDMQIIHSHLAFLDDSNQKEIYRLLTQSIIENGQKL